MARSFLKEGGLPNQYWAEAIATLVYLLNLSPTKVVKNCTPYEAWRGIKPIVSHLRIFGCIAFTLIPSQHHQNLDSKVEKCIFIGYSTKSKAYKLYNPITLKVIVSRDVVFNEDGRWDWSERHQAEPNKILLDPIEVAPSSIILFHNNDEGLRRSIEETQQCSRVD